MPLECRCGYKAENTQDLQDHIEISSRIDDGEHHGEKR